jgi:hypothetical protein
LLLRLPIFGFWLIISTLRQADNFEAITEWV